MTIKVFLDPINRELIAERGDILLDIMRDAGVRIESLCGGKGFCGKCKVILDNGRVEKKSTIPDKYLSQQELDAGYYLACMVRLLEDCKFTIPTESRIDSPKILLSAELSLDELDPSSKKYMLETSPFADTPLLIPQED